MYAKNRRKNNNSHKGQSGFLRILVIFFILLTLFFAVYKLHESGVLDELNVPQYIEKLFNDGEGPYKKNIASDDAARALNAEKSEVPDAANLPSDSDAPDAVKGALPPDEADSSLASRSLTSETSATSVNKKFRGNDSYATELMELPLCYGTGDSNSEDHEIHYYKGFELCYRESYEVAEWVSYTLTKEEALNNAGRTNDFRLDPSITTGSALPSDYYKSGYDRGHLAPAADMGWSSESVSESFYMSNMTPQLPDFNRGMWKDLEGMVRQWAVRFGEVTVVTGPVLEKSAAEYSSIGKNNVSVPEFFYKALLAQNEGKYISIGFILPNKKCTGTVFDYAVSVDEVERRTELDFFSRLPDSVEEFVESRTDYSLWK